MVITMRMKVVCLTTFVLCIPVAMKAQTSAVEASEKALKRSQLTQPGSKPFHLIASMTEKDSPNSDYQAKVEMFWSRR